MEKLAINMLAEKNMLTEKENERVNEIIGNTLIEKENKLFLTYNDEIITLDSFLDDIEKKIDNQTITSNSIKILINIYFELKNRGVC